MRRFVFAILIAVLCAGCGALANWADENTGIVC
jgi:hypothetical protein